MKRDVRSQSYQHLFNEISFSNEMLTAFAEENGLTAAIIEQHNEELLDLKEDLKVEFWRLVEENLTERQQEVLKLSAQGYTQTEIAKKLGVNQSSITKSINGNTDYKKKKVCGSCKKGDENKCKMKKENGYTCLDKRNKKVISYGGGARKIRKLAEEDEKIQAIFKRIAEINAEMAGF